MFRTCFLLLLSSSLMSFGLGHDTYEITLDLTQKRNRIDAHLEMARSTSVAACDPEPSLGILFDPADFEEWKTKLETAAPDLIQILNTGDYVESSSIKVGLSREDDVTIDYIFNTSGSDELELHTPILSRFSDEGYGVRVTFRDKSGFWHPPFIIFAEKQNSALPPQ